MRKLNPEQVRNLLGVSNHTLKYWRDPKRLPGGTDNTLYLPATPDAENPNVIWYSVDDLMEFLHKNEKYGNRALARLAPADAIAVIRTPLPAGPGLLGLHLFNETADQPQPETTTP